jgi:hypothetical protein
MFSAFFLAATAPACDVEGATRTLRAMHQAVIAHHLNDNVDAWMGMEAETLIVGSRGELGVSGPERAAQRRAYLGATSFDYYRDMTPPIVRVADDCSLGWVMVQVEASGTRRGEDGAETPIAFQSSWIELYERVEGQWRAVGNVSNFVD